MSGKETCKRNNCKRYQNNNYGWKEDGWKGDEFYGYGFDGDYGYKNKNFCGEENKQSAKHNNFDNNERRECDTAFEEKKCLNEHLKHDVDKHKLDKEFEDKHRRRNHQAARHRARQLDRGHAPAS